VSPNRSSSCGRSSPSSGFIVPISTIREACATETPSRSTGRPAHGRRIEQQVDEMIMEQVDFVDVEDAAVGGGEQTGLVGHVPGAERLLQIEGTDHPILARTDRQLHQSRGSLAELRLNMRAVRTQRIGLVRVTAESAALDDRDRRQHVSQRPDHGRLGRPLLAATSTPPTSGATVVRISASARSSDPTTAENGNDSTSHPSCSGRAR
jgi:hypothetical protein